MREILVTDLVKNLLGPRGGVRESLDNEHLPLSEYITGVLAPKTDVDQEYDNTLSQIPKDVEIEAEDYSLGQLVSTKDSDYDDGELDEGINSMINPTINPHKIPSTMGISFYAKSNSILKFNICLTWATYVPDSNKKPKIWNRHPKYCIFEITGSNDDTKYFDSDGKLCSKNKSELSFHLKISNMKDNSFFVSMFLVNRKKYVRKLSTTSHIFQPQIRVLKKDDTDLIPMKSSLIQNDNDDMLKFLYRDKKFFAKGHMTSAVWENVDPEISDVSEDSSKHPHEPGFFWIDSEIIPEDEVTPFLRPTVRTEYIPMYSIPSPDWFGSDKELPSLSAKDLSEMWDPQILKNALQPFVDEYQKWINNIEKQQLDSYDLVDEIINKCNICLKRMISGINLLLNDNDARLAFCFANMAINLQQQWIKKDSKQSDMHYRPFQIAFILMSIESILNKTSTYRDVCDLLWVPTGAGKTEAYLVLVAIDMAYRRLQSLKDNKSGVGVSVFTRYTLRLLTIQQFRRALSMFCAAELLRVENVGAKNSIGWCPKEFQSTSNILWGSTPFSIGLWVGKSVTPNRLDSTGPPNNRYIGALDILTHDPTLCGDGEPAQVLNCPACDNILAIPTGTDKVGLEPNKQHSINWIISSDQDLVALNPKLSELKNNSIKIMNSKFEFLNNNFFIFSIDFESNIYINSISIRSFWSQINHYLKDKKNINVVLQSTAAARPGYFFKTYCNEKGHRCNYDFEIFCTNNSCPLKQKWFGGAPMGSTNDSFPDPNRLVNNFDDITLNDNNYFMEAQRCFRNQKFISNRIPIPGLTVDDQIYKTLPTMIVSTVDKFARIPFQPSIGNLFGNVEYCHVVHGYYRLREKDKHPHPTGRGNSKLYRPLNKNEIPSPPNFIIQDELHLIEGPLGSMVGIYESCVDFLAKENNINIKYIASTATTKDGDKQVESLFSRKFQIFPPHGVDIDDRFFIREQTAHALQDKKPGRLYLGIMSPGRGAITPIVRIWARLAQSAYENKNNPEIDRFWTLIGYFNTIKELAGTRSLYRQNIPDWVSHLSPSYRPLLEENLLELSGRTSSDALPSIFGILNKKYQQDADPPADAMFTTSMFGTGVDVSRLGLMFMDGQPKTTSTYIQSTGRVGRQKGGLVVVFHKATRPRDLSHYEYFIRHHIQLHRSVESSTVHPFSFGVIDKTLGSLIVGMLRNMRDTSTPWHYDDTAPLMEKYSKCYEISNIKNFLESRSQTQPTKRRPDKLAISKEIDNSIKNWIKLSQSTETDNYVLKYYEYTKPKNPVVLGDLMHTNNPTLDSVFEDTPQSLRSLEGETSFES